MPPAYHGQRVGAGGAVKLMHYPALRFLVLDELHAYRGALATEIACLIRRLKANAALPPGRLVGIGTSATVAEGAGGAEALAAFATDLFGEPFRAADVVTEAYVASPDARAPRWDPPFPDLAGIDLAALDPERDEAVVALAEGLTGRAAPREGHVAERVSALFHGNTFVQELEPGTCWRAALPLA